MIFLIASSIAATQPVEDVQASAPEVAERNADIVVTGTREQGYRATVAPQVNKSDTALKQTPFSVQVVTRELIEDRGVVTLGEALRYVPGLSPQVGFGAANDRFTIRGFTVPFNYKNGFRRSGFTTNEQLANIEQIEILKGPASALYGRAESGGVVNIVTKRPLAEPMQAFGAQYGSFDALRLTADINQPLGEGLGLRVNASYDDADSYRDFAFAREFFIAPVLAWQLGADTTLTLEGEYSTRDSFFDRGFGNNAIFLTAPRERQFANRDARLERETGLASLFLEHRLSEALSARFAASFSEGTVDGLFYPYGFPAVFGATGPNPQVNVRQTDSYDRQRNVTVQGELYARFQTGALSHKALIGVERGTDDWDYFWVARPPIAIDFNNPVYPDPITGEFVPTIDGFSDSKATAIYAQDEIALGAFRLLVGGRYDWNETAALDRIFGPDPALVRSEGAFSPRVGLTFTPSPAVSLYASWSRSFLPQTFGLLRGGGLPTALRGESWEAGAKFSLLSGRLTPTVALFDIERTGAAVSDPDDFTFVVQLGRSRTRGIEIDVPAAITPRWRVIASYTHLDAKITADTSIPVGTQLINAPDHSASLWTTWDVPGALDGLSIGGGVLYIGDRAGNSFGSIVIPGYTRYDANLTYEFEVAGRSLRAQVNALNLTDKFFYDSGGGFLPVYPAAPRTVTASLTVRFGAGK
ncbi:TonB-dependent siderophore receptor [Leptolyngbya sp. 15MV]|nr:TonB-dependent siderophore receptor [Leptolyngbya sp. 15MV]